jgi:hypothetical protein
MPSRHACGRQPHQAFDPEGGLSELEARETLPPPFDLEEFARKQMEQERALSAPPERPTEPAPVDPTGPVALGAEGDYRPRSERIRAELVETLSAGDYDAALSLAEELCSGDPTQTTARAFAEECRTILEAACVSRLGSLDQVPHLAAPLDGLRSLSLDHQAGFVLSRVDGVSSLEVLLDICAMPRLDVLRLVARLVDYGVIRLESCAEFDALHASRSFARGALP